MEIQVVIILVIGILAFVTQVIATLVTTMSAI